MQDSGRRIEEAADRKYYVCCKREEELQLLLRRLSLLPLIATLLIRCTRLPALFVRHVGPAQTPIERLHHSR